MQLVPVSYSDYPDIYISSWFESSALYMNGNLVTATAAAAMA